MGEMTKTELEMAAGRQRLQELQNRHQAEQVLGAKMLAERSSPPSIAPVEEFEGVALPAIQSRKKKNADVGELLDSLRPPDKD